MAGYLSRPSLPSVENGGPIPKNFEDRMRYPLCPICVGLTLGKCKFVFNDWASSRVDTPGEEDEETPQSVTSVETDLVTREGFEPAPISIETKQTLASLQTPTNTETIKTRNVMVGAVKAASMMMYATVFQALLNRVEALEMDRDNAIIQLGNLRI